MEKSCNLDPCKKQPLAKNNRNLKALKKQALQLVVTNDGVVGVCVDSTAAVYSRQWNE